MSRLDRFLVSESMLIEWNIIGQWVGKRDISDHCPIWLKCCVKDWGPKSFKFNNCWMDHENFNDFVRKEWKRCVVKGRGDFVMIEKLKLLKEKLRGWNRDAFGWVDTSIEDIVTDLNNFDKIMADNLGGNDHHLAENKRRVENELWQKLETKERFLRLKSRQLWLKEGDSNSKFFHNAMRARYRRNFINVVDTPSEIREEAVVVKSGVKRHFENLFKEHSYSKPVSEGLVSKNLTTKTDCC